jgi:hypothetical protein
MTPDPHDVNFVLTARQLRDRSRTLRDRLATEVATFHRARELLRATPSPSFLLAPCRDVGNATETTSTGHTGISGSG